jgi:hypothetical protein
MAATLSTRWLRRVTLSLRNWLHSSRMSLHVACARLTDVFFNDRKRTLKFSREDRTRARFEKHTSLEKLAPALDLYIITVTV